MRSHHVHCLVAFMHMQANALSLNRTVPRKVLRESFDSPLELDELDQNAPAFESEFDEDDHIYKESEAIPPAPKLQGAIPRTNDSHTIGAENAVPSNSISTPNQTDKIAEGQTKRPPDLPHGERSSINR